MGAAKIAQWKLKDTITDPLAFAKIFARAKEVESGCIEWTAAKDFDGYGKAYYEGKLHMAHRLFYRFFVGPVDGLAVCHKCDNPSCVNIDHLFLGTHADNAQDRNRKRRQAFGKRNGSAKLSEEQVLDIRLRKHVANSVLALEYGVTKPTIYAIKQGKIWKHLLNTPTPQKVNPVTPKIEAK